VLQEDRRQATRLEFVDDQWGSLDGHDMLRLCNVGRDGALVESTAAMPLGSVQDLRLVHPAGSAQCRAAVRHLSPRSSGADQPLYLIGLQFLGLDDQAIAFVDHMLAGWPASSLSNEV